MSKNPDSITDEGREEKSEGEVEGEGKKERKRGRGRKRERKRGCRYVILFFRIFL
jgi:hypothetical protein